MILAILLAAWPSFIDRLFHKEHPASVEGNALEAQHKHEEALQQYDKLAGELPEDSPSQAATQLDRSSALLGFASPEKAPAAASAAARALQHGDNETRAKAAYNLGLSLEQMGKPDEAMKMYAEALKLDPNDEDAKVNLELLLRTDEQKKQQPVPNDQQKENKDPQKDQQNQQQQQAGQDQQKEQQKKNEGEQQQQEKQQQSQSKEQQEQQAQKDQQKKEQLKAPEKPVDRSEAERLLDALRAGEKNLQAWRFAKEKKKEAQRGEVEKDW